MLFLIVVVFVVASVELCFSKILDVIPGGSDCDFNFELSPVKQLIQLKCWYEGEIKKLKIPEIVSV